MSRINNRNTKTTVKKSRVAKSDDDSASYDASVTDVDDSSEIDPIEYDVDYNIQSSQSSQLRELHTFFSDAKMINGKNNPTTNIIDRFTGKPYNVPERKIPKMFKILEACRLSKQKLMFAERQQDYSGIMLDFDIYQDAEDDQLTDEIFHVLCQKIIELLMKIINFGETKKEVIYIGITRKPKIMYKEEHGCHKDGFHILMPGIKVQKGVKKLIINKLIENEIIDQVMAEVEPANINVKGLPYQRNDFLDKNSATVPVFFIGSRTKKESVAYVLSHVYEATINFEMKNIMLKPHKLAKNKDANICHEFSLNYECPGGTIKKHNYEACDKYNTEIQELNRNDKEVEEANKNYGALSMNSVHDAQIKEIQELLDTLSPARHEDYGMWRDVVFALANTSVSYKDLAEYFSRKSKDKFNMTDFEKMWTDATRGPIKNRRALTLGSIHYWAKQDNPERYKQLRNMSVYNTALTMVYETYKEGTLSHSDISELLYRLLKHKFITDIPEGEKYRIWYEFILDDDDHIEGELYKWRRWPGTPVSLMRYISETLPTLFDQVLKCAKKKYDDSIGDLSKYYKKVLDNLKSTMRKLGDRNFKKNVMAESEDKFSKLGFSSMLDKEPLIRGVANGVLKLSQRGQGPQLVQGYHSYMISKYTDVPYIAFDPYDPLTKKILITLRKMFPDNEPDSFEFTMYYLSSTLDGNPKESMFMLMVGVGSNGKTFLVELHKSAIGNIYGVKLPLNYLTSKNSSADTATPATMLLKDATFAYFSESDKYEVLNAARMKEITGQETLAGRKLHQDMINFKPKCHYLVTSNNDFDITSHDWGTWRRMCYNPLKIRFVDINNEKIDKSDPCQREADDSITDTWTADPDVRGRYLGFMVWMHFWLYHTPEYRGKVKRVPHQHVAFETEKYRRRQDVVSAFLAQRLVKVKGVDGETDTAVMHSMYEEIQKYTLWYQKTQGGLLIGKGLIEMFQNSQIGNLIKKTKRGPFLVGHRFLDNNEEPAENEEYAMKNIFDIEAPADNFGIIPETPEEYYDKVCKKYDAYKHLFNGQAKYDVDTTAESKLFSDDTIGLAPKDGDLDPTNPNNLTLGNYDLSSNKGTSKYNSILNTYNKYTKASDTKSVSGRSDNIEINGRILPNGIVLRALEEPSVNYLTDEYAVDITGFLPADEDSDFEDNDFDE
jgi:phage/plasmid-associated DNA primase